MGLLRLTADCSHEIKATQQQSISRTADSGRVPFGMLQFCQGRFDWRVLCNAVHNLEQQRCSREMTIIPRMNKLTCICRTQFPSMTLSFRPRSCTKRRLRNQSRRAVIFTVARLRPRNTLLVPRQIASPKSCIPVIY